ncbi:hypothetical protein [Yersinia rochesterensis]|nr:hypothetical protein [Yersinia rochesterensis]
MSLITASEINQCPEVISTFNSMEKSVNPASDDKKPILLALTELMKKLENNAIK